MILVFLGPPGSGKGTQAKMAAEKFAVPQIVAGDILREEAAKETLMGEKIRAAINAGRLAPEEVTVNLIESRIKRPDCGGGFILDGFPRSLTQAEALDGILNRNNLALDGVIYLDVSQEAAVNRLLNRAGLEGRADDKREVIATRFAVYGQETEPLVARYQKAGKLSKIMGEGSIPEIFEKIVAAVCRHAGQA